MLTHEKSLDRVICEKFDIEPSGESEGARRLDFFCLGDRYNTAFVVEAKRPGDIVGREEFDQLRDYVLFLQRKLQDESTNPEDRRTDVRGLLIADRIRTGDERHGKANQDAGTFDIRTWDNLLLTAETMHAEFLEIVRLRAPADDPRLAELSADDSGDRKSTSTRTRKRKASGGKKVGRKKRKKASK